jgi:hypothetical protein
MRYAQLGSLVVFAIGFALYAVPALRRSSRANALIALLWIHAFRYVAVLVVPARAAGYPISTTAVREIVAGDVLGAVLALVGIGLLRHKSRAGIAVAWLVLVEMIADVAIGVHRRVIEPLAADPTGSMELVLGFFVPLLIVSLPFLAWQLIARRGQPLASDRS